jgi:hypothetical protein
MLKAGGEQFSDAGNCVCLGISELLILVATSIEKWPPKLQHLDVDGNCLSSIKVITCLLICKYIV